MKPGAALQTSSSSIDSWIHSLSHIFSPTALRRRHAQANGNSTFSYKVIVIKNFINPERITVCIIGSKVMAILLKQWIMPFLKLHWLPLQPGQQACLYLLCLVREDTKKE